MDTTSTLPRGSSSLRIANDIAYLPAVTAYGRVLAGEMGFDEKSVSQIELALEESVSNVIEHAFSPSEDATFDIHFLRHATGLEVIIHDMGLPYDPSLIPEYDPKAGLDAQTGKGLGWFLIKKLTDDFQFKVLGSQGKMIRFVKHLPSESVVREGPGQGLFEKIVAEEEPAREVVELAVRPMHPSEAIEIARCIYDAYGYTYVFDNIYYPDRLAAMNEEGRLFSAVAAAPDGEIAGHMALIFHEEYPGTPEIGIAVTKKKFRGQKVAMRITDYLLTKARELGQQGVFAKQVTAHVYSQKFLRKVGFINCAVLLAYGPKTMSFKGIAEELAQRETEVLGYLPFIPMAASTAYLPPRHADIIMEIYDRFAVAHELATPPENPFDHDQPASLSVNVNMKRSLGALGIEHAGRDTLSRLHKELYRVKSEGVEVIEVGLNITEPSTPALSAYLEAQGFVFTGLRPRPESGDLLVHQFLNGVVVDYDAIHLYGKNAGRYLDYIRSNDPSAP